MKQDLFVLGCCVLAVCVLIRLGTAAPEPQVIDAVPTVVVTSEVAPVTSESDLLSELVGDLPDDAREYRLTIGRRGERSR